MNDKGFRINFNQSNNTLNFMEIHKVSFLIRFRAYYQRENMIVRNCKNKSKIMIIDVIILCHDDLFLFLSSYNSVSAPLVGRLNSLKVNFFSRMSYVNIFFSFITFWNFLFSRFWLLSVNRVMLIYLVIHIYVIHIAALFSQTQIVDFRR